MFYRVNMATLTVTEDAGAQYKGLAGRALTSRIVKNEVDANAHALGKLNKLILAPGFLTGTFAPNAGRMSFGAKSPLTGTIKESNVGGFIGHKLARTGAEAIIVEDIVQDGKLYTMVVTKDGVKLEECPELKGLNIYDATAKLQEKYGKKAGIAV
ncbi:aldehyde ferredoxin oxidoreductase N-terminal domain-containing protein, partial [Sporomusa sp.]|uniref:aldehyde ferredoxin oxidoreductase N-terminal domain-containing protein n=1 Tax=Sporomusa sp. TaxID=2078658 RepID=UPI002B7EA436